MLSRCFTPEAAPCSEGGTVEPSSALGPYGGAQAGPQHLCVAPTDIGE